MLATSSSPRRPRRDRSTRPALRLGWEMTKPAARRRRHIIGAGPARFWRRTETYAREVTAMGAVIVLLGILAFLVFVGFATSVRVVQQFEQGIVFRFGKVQLNGVRQAGLTSIVPIADRMQ